MSQWFVYILKCGDNTLYCGSTVDVERRVIEHNTDDVKGAKYTRVRRPVKMVYSEKCDDRSAAGQREWAIKQLTRKVKLELIKVSKA
jgi:putative endonuclease